MHLLIYEDICNSTVARKRSYCLSNLLNISLLIMPDFLFIKTGIMDFKTEFYKRYVIMTVYFFCFFFSMRVFFHEHSRITGLQEKGEGISSTPHYRLQPLHRHLDISRAITAKSSILHIASSRTRTENLWIPNASR